MHDHIVLYLQPTLGPAHLARIRALNCQPRFRCRGVQLASRERTRDYRPSAEDLALTDTLVDGVYEAVPRRHVIAAGRRLLARLRPDAIVIDRPSDPVQAILAALARRQGALALTRWASVESDFARRRWKEWLKGFVYRRYDGYLVTGVRAREYLETFGVPPTRIFVCGNPSDDAFARLVATQPDGAREDTFVYAGRFLAFKNLRRLIAAYARYRAGGGNWSLSLVGFGDEEARLRAAATGVPGIVFSGHLQLPALAGVFARAGALVLPSESEPWGLVVGEAMDCGAPVIVSRRCGCFPELVVEGENGLGLDPFDEAQMAETLRRFSSLSQEARVSMSRRSREIARGHGAAAWAERVAHALRTLRPEWAAE